MLVSICFCVYSLFPISGQLFLFISFRLVPGLREPRLQHDRIKIRNNTSPALAEKLVQGQELRVVPDLVTVARPHQNGHCIAPGRTSKMGGALRDISGASAQAIFFGSMFCKDLRAARVSPDP